MTSTNISKLMVAMPLLLALVWAPVILAQTLKIASIAPEGSTWMNEMRAGAGEISERTGGRVKFKFYGGGVQGSDKQVRRKMRTGQLHGGVFTSGAMNGFQKDADLYALPLMFNSVEEVQFVRERMDAELRQRMEDAGFVNFGFAAGGFAYMMSNKPIATLADFGGQKVWTPEGDKISYAALQALGVAPVTMPITDVLTGLQTDLLDSVAVPPVGAVVLQWHTKLKYITELPVSYVYGALLIDKKAFSKVSPEDQSVIREVMEAIYLKFNESGISDNQEALRALLDSGLQLAKPAAEEVQSWRGIVTRSHHDQASSGVFDEELLNELQAYLGQFRSAQLSSKN
jgi:TRAP-type C4-dicarboxylate transport system substrate-binding protein